MLNYNEKPFVNIGSGEDVSIKELALMIKDLVGFDGELRFDSSKPDGTPRKLMDVGRLHQLGWKHQIDLPQGLKLTYEDFLQQRVKKM